jgi:hypothetical protein
MAPPGVAVVQCQSGTWAALPCAVELGAAHLLARPNPHLGFRGAMPDRSTPGRWSTICLAWFRWCAGRS